MREILDLGGAWEFCGSPHGRASAPRAGWRPASVPGCVHTDLMAAGTLEDPWIGRQEEKAAWVEDRDWWYRRRFQFDPSNDPPGAYELRAEGLDTFATLWLNNRMLGTSRNMFMSHSFPAGGFLRRGENELLLRFSSPTRVLEAIERREGRYPATTFPPRVWGRKAACSFGWDWGPRLATSGIFKPIRLVLAGPLEVGAPFVRLDQCKGSTASGLVEIRVEARRAGREALDFGLEGFSFHKQVSLKPGLQTFRFPFHLKSPRLWSPRGLGRPNLLAAHLRLGPSGMVTPVGLRKACLLRKADAEGESFILEVNGAPVFCKGANWIPADTFLSRVTPAKVEDLLEKACRGNFNMLRVWGGGVYESEEFYAACDRKGLLVWQDFPFACSFMPEKAWLMEEIRREATQAMQRLRRHPSLVLWCGNNENHVAREDGWFGAQAPAGWGKSIYHRLLPAVARKMDPSTPYWPGSPYGGPRAGSQTHGDHHQWKVWGEFQDYLEYRKVDGRFISEFGFAALPNRAVLDGFVPPGERHLQSKTLALHDKVNQGGIGRLLHYAAMHLPLSLKWDDFRYLTQVNQGEALSTGIQHWRRRQFRTSGALVWQLNDCWPALSWSLLDSASSPKLAFYAAGSSFDPVLLSVFEDGAPPHLMSQGTLPDFSTGGLCQAWLTHEGAGRLKGRLAVELWDMRGRLRRLEEARVDLPPRASAAVWSAERAQCGVSDPSSQFLVFHFEGAGERRQALLFFERPKHLRLGPERLRLSVHPVAGGVELVLRSARLAKSVELHPPCPGWLHDNGFDLLPGVLKTVKFSTSDTEAARRGWSWKCLNQITRD